MTTRSFATLTLLCVTAACDGPSEPATTAAAVPATAEAPKPALPAIKIDKGVDLEHKTVRLGVLNGESGPAATIGKPEAVGKRVLAAQINAGGSGLLPEGWKIQLVERDHGYNPQKSVQAYNEIKDDVLMVAHSFGTPNTLPLRPMLERDKMIALPASLSSQMAQNRYTIPGGPSYEVEAMRAMDFAVAQQEKAGKPKAAIKAAIVYQRDDYGQDGLSGWKKAAAHHGIKVISEQSVMAGQRDFAAIVSSLKSAGATHVMLTILPSATGPLLGEAAERGYRPAWFGQTPTWIDGFFNPQVIARAVFANYFFVSGMPYWGEDTPGMSKFVAAYEKFGKDQSPQDSYLLLSYSLGLLAVELVRRGIEAGDLTREGLLAMIPKITSFDGGGLFKPEDLSKFPYVTGTQTRVMRPDFDKRSWIVLGDWASPSVLDTAPAGGGKTAAATPAATGVSSVGFR